MTSLEIAEQALAAGSWKRARSAFSAIIEEDADPRAYEGLAQVGWWLDDAQPCLMARESAYRRYQELGDPVGAARTATALAWDCMLFGAGESVALGWLGRARELLARTEEAAEHGWLSVREAELALAVRHDPARALGFARRAAGVGRRTGDGDLAIVGRALEGLALLRSGQVETGMARLDSAVAAATAGDVVDLMWVGKVLCWLIAACHETRDVTRAEDWCRRVEGLCLDRDLVPLLHVCRIQHASVQVAGGTWPEAERQLTETLHRLGSSQRASRLEAVVQLGELRRLQGRFDEADALFQQVEFDPVAVVGRALIRLAAGEPTSAWPALRGLLRELPRQNRLARADALLPAVRVAEAAGEREAAVEAADELRETAAAVRTDALLGMSAVADALLAAPSEAVPLLRQAVRSYQRAGLRHDQAEARLMLAASLVASGDAVAAGEQIGAACDLLREVTDTAALAYASRLAAMLPGGPDPLLTPRETEVLGLVARGMTNEEIASVLVISPHTVHRHVANILTKLEQPTRAGAVSHALSTGMVL